MSLCSWDAKNRKLVVEGLTIVNPGERPDAKMSLEDFSSRESSWIRQITLHTTGGHWPQPIIAGAGPGGHAKDIARYWRTNPEYGGAPFVIDTDGTVWLLIDPFKYVVWHATTVNPYSIGIEMCTLPDGSIYQATLNACVTLVKALCELCGIPFQTTSRPYKTNTVIERLKDGGKYVVGVFGHHDNAWVFPWQYKNIYKTPAEIHNALKKWPNGYANRGKGDPGTRIKEMLIEAGAMAFDYDKREEIAFWKPVQVGINKSHGMKLDEDGIYGPAMHAAMKKFGYWTYAGIFPEKPIIA